MKRSHRNYLMVIGGLILATALVMVYTGATPLISTSPVVSPVPPALTGEGVVGISGALVQDKVLYGADGHVTMSLSLVADKQMASSESNDGRHVDMVIVLDRSGSMAGEKMTNARAAVCHLIRSLTPEDRIALVAYADDVRRYIDLTPVSETNLHTIENAVFGIDSGGGTNLGAGLAEGLNLLEDVDNSKRLKKMVLISDGLANQGTTNPDTLGDMAAMAPEILVSLTTVGVGLDFNEHLMTHLADRGTGDFYFLENPQAFAEVFLREYRNIRTTVATSLAVKINLPEGVELVEAAGYPVFAESGSARFHPGDLRSGQKRKIFLTFRIPTDRINSYRLDNISVQYRMGGAVHTARVPTSFEVACVKHRKDVYASIKKSEWEKKVLQDDYNKLKEEVAFRIKDGRQDEALAHIDAYRKKQSALNAVLGSSEVQQNLDQDLGELSGMVNDTFEGEADVVMQKKKRNSKSLQYDSYQKRRAK